MNTILIPVIFSVGLVIGILASYVASRRANRANQQVELNATREEYLNYRSSAQEALESAEASLEALQSHTDALQERIDTLKGTLNTPPTFVGDASETRQLPHIKDASTPNTQTAATQARQPNDYVTEEA